MDPVGIWWGLRLSGDGKSPGISIPILGGSHGDIPLEPSSGAKVADFIVDTGTAVVLDVSEFTGGEQQKFVAEFARHLFERKKRESSPMLLIWEEAQEFVPQNVFKDSARMVGAVERITKIGRNFGIGTGLISQRPQEVNKKVLNQTEVLFVFQTTGPQERKAIEGWIVEHGLDLSKVVEELPSLPQGTGYIWSPQWLRVFKKIRCNSKETFDASATPEFDGKARKKINLAPIDLKKLEESMKATIEKARAEDPKELRKRIAELEVEVRKMQAVKPKMEVKEVPVLDDKEKQLLENVTKNLHQLRDKVVIQTETIAGQIDLLRPILARTLGVAQVRPVQLSFKPSARAQAVPRVTTEGEAGEAKFSSGERKILTVLAQYPQGRTKVQVAVVAGYAHRGGSYNNYLSALRSKEWVNGKDMLQITPEGLKSLGVYEPLPTGQALLHHWLSQLGRAEREILRVLASAYPTTLTKEDVAREAGYEVRGGGFNNALGKLRTLELVHGRTELQAAEELF